MHSIILHSHSGLRHIILLLLIFALIQAYSKRNETDFSNNKIPLYALIFMHIQVLLGLFLYFTSDMVQFVSGFMKDESLRFYGVEHILGMVIAAIIITIGYSKAKKVGFKAILTYYTIGLLLILISIPWPIRLAGGSWF